jgi:hypothetical protein
MSVWGTNPSENDDAADWLSELEETPSLESLQEAFSEIVTAPDTGYFEITECCIAVAAAEVLAELFGASGKDPLLEEETLLELKAEVDSLSAGNKKKLLLRAAAAVELVLNDKENSELRQAWEDDEEDMAAWSTGMRNLENRLSGIAARVPG